MDAKETLDTIEKSLDVIEGSLDATEETLAYIAKMKKQHIIYLVVGTQVAWWGGGALAWYLTKKHYTAKYESVIKQEIEEAKAFYSRFYKQDDFKTPQGTAEALGVNAATEALEQYQGKGLEVEEETEVEVIPISETKNIFADRETDLEDWNLEEEIKNRTDQNPYVVSQDEFREAERDYLQHTLTYYAEDDVLVDEGDKPIEEVDSVVGEGNLLRFGHGSNDNRIVYIRNDRLSLDFEIVKNDGSYAKEVLGFQHDDGGHKINKFRGDDD